MPLLTLGSTRLNYRVEGEQGPCLVLIHEMGGSLQSWDFVLPNLKRNWRVLRYDQRGAGQSSPVDQNLTLDQLTDDLYALLDNLQIGSPITLCASALGAAVALEFAAQYSGFEHQVCVDRMIFLSPALSVAQHQKETVISTANLIEKIGAEAFSDQSLDFAYPQRFRTDPQFELYKKIHRHADSRSQAAYWRLLANLDMNEKLANMSIPTLIVAGTYDLIRPPELIPKPDNHHFKEIPSGHFMALQTPEIVASLIDGATDLHNQSNSSLRSVSSS